MTEVTNRRLNIMTELRSNGRSSKTPTLVRRACDQCHGRKVKCDGKLPCRTCTKHGGVCSFLKPVRRKGPAPKVRVGSQDPLRTAPLRSADVEPGPSRREPASSTPLISTSRRLSADSQGLDTSYDDCERRVRFEELIPIEPPIAEAIGHVSPTTTIDYWLDSLESLNAGRVVEWTDGLELQTEDVPFSASEAQYPPIDFGEGLGLDFGSTNYGAVQVYTSPSLSSPGVNSAYINAYASQSFSPGSWTLPTAVQEQISPLFDSVLDTLIKPQLEIFFIRVYPMIPIYTRDEILAGLQDRRQLRRPGFVALVLSMAALSLVHPLPAGEMTFKPIRGQQATILMDEACRLVASWDHGCDPSVEGILISYLMFGTLFELGHAAGARLRLKEAVTMGEAMHLDLGWGYQSCTVEENARRTRLFWVLAITERAYALQREGSIIFGGSISRPTVSTPTDSSGQLLHYLAIVFSHIDQEIVSCWNGRCGGTKCSNLSQKRAVRILRELKGTAKKVFGDALLPELNETQKADLLITWQWIRNRIWRLASLHGFSTEDGEPELSVEYVLDIARTTLGICERLSSSSMEAHGIGFVEKLYDIASTVIDQIKSHHKLRARVRALVKDATCIDTLNLLAGFVSRHPSGLSISNTLAEEVGQARNTAQLICIS